MSIIMPFKTYQQYLKETEKFNRICEIQDKEKHDKEMGKFLYTKYFNVRQINNQMKYNVDIYKK